MTPDDEDKNPEAFEDADGLIEADHAEIATRAGDGPGDSQAIAMRKSMRMQVSAFSGPLPRPEVFAKYEEACPGAGGRIIEMGEEEGRHRRAMEARSLDAAIATERRGQVFGFVAVMSCLLGGGALLLLGVPGPGIALVIGSLGTMFVAAIWNRIQQKKDADRAEKQAEAPPKEDPASSNGKPQRKPKRKPRKKK